MRVLVEDNVVNQKVLRKHLVRCNCDVEVANHGVKALDMLCSSSSPSARFDVVSMDVQVPVMDSLTCTRRIRALEQEGMLLGRLPIIAVTVNVRQEQIEDAIEAGADRVVQKPFKAADLVILMQALVGGIKQVNQFPSAMMV
jgi:CheY-like chemotaxis protein